MHGLLKRGAGLAQLESVADAPQVIALECHVVQLHLTHADAVYLASAA
jgi:hypothetical protein